MKSFVLSGALALGLFAATSAQALEKGDWVLSQWKGSTQYFPGVIAEKSGNTARVEFDDGAVENRPLNLLRPFNWIAGSKIACQWTDGQWYAATITFMGEDGLTMRVRYDDDGVMQNTKTGKCRTR